MSASMKLYDVYVCVEIKCRRKVKVPRGEKKPEVCPKCGGLMAKLVSLK